MKRRRHSREQWQAWLDEHADSGLSVRHFCNAKGVGEKSFYLWRKKLPGNWHRQADTIMGVAAENKKTPSSPFVALSVIESSVVESSQMVISLPCGATVRMPVSEQTTRNVLTTLVALSEKSVDKPGNKS